MSAEKSPQGKKRYALDRDHVSPARDKGFRATWPRKKAKLNRAFRLRARVALATAEDEGAVDAVRRKSARKWEILSMREAIGRRLAKRAGMVGARKRRRASRAEPGEG